MKKLQKGSATDAKPKDANIASAQKRRADDDSLDPTNNTPTVKTPVHPQTFPGGGRKGVSSGLSTVVKRRESQGKSAKALWWKELKPM